MRRIHASPGSVGVVNSAFEIALERRLWVSGRLVTRVATRSQLVASQTKRRFEPPLDAAEKSEGDHG